MNQTALINILSDITENMEWMVREIQRLQGAVEALPQPEVRSAYLAGVGVKDDALTLGSIRVLRERLAAMRRDPES